VFLGVETHGKAMGIGDEEVRIEPRRSFSAPSRADG
jgi:hypothetical protein